jgi:hypothetical protein
VLVHLGIMLHDGDLGCEPSLCPGEEGTRTGGADHLDEDNAVAWG